MKTLDFFYYYYYSTPSFHFAIFLMKNTYFLYMGSIHGADKTLYQSRIGMFAIILARVEMISGFFTSSLFLKSKLLLNSFQNHVLEANTIK